MEFSQAGACLLENSGMPVWHSIAASSRASRLFTEILVEFKQSSCMILVYCFIVYLLHGYLGNRFQRRRERDILLEHKKQCEAEQGVIVKLRNLERASNSRLMQPFTSSVPKRRRSTAPQLERRQSSVGKNFRGLRDASLLNENIQHFVSLSMSPIGEDLCSYFFEKVGEDAEEVRQNQSTCCKLGEDEDQYIAQTQIELSDDVLTLLNKLAEESLDNSQKNVMILQLGKFQIYLRSPKHDSNRVEQLKIEDTQSVPVVLHATYAAGTVTIYGFGLTGANIMLATSTKCIMLQTMSHLRPKVRYIHVDHLPGADGLEKHTCVVTPPSKNIAQVSVYATKNIDVQGHEVCVSSLAISLQDDNWRLVFRELMPATIILLYAAKQILFLMYFIHRTTPAAIYLWLLLPVLVVLLTQFLPKNAESAFRKWCKRMYACSYLMLYFASQSLLQESDSQIPSLNFTNSDRGPSKQYLKPEMSDVSEKSDDSDDDSSDGRKNKRSKRKVKKDRNIRSPDWEWPVYDCIQKRFQSRLVRRTSNERGKGRAPFKVIYRNLKDLPWASQVRVEILSPALVKIIDDLIPGKVDRRNQTRVSLEGTELFFIYQKLKDLFESMRNPWDSPTPGQKGLPTEASFHLKHLLRFLDEELKIIDEMHASMKSQRSLSHDLLWAFFPPGEIISYKCEVTDEDCCGSVKGTFYDLDLVDDRTVIFYIEISVYDYNCKTWSKSLITREMRHFQGDRSFDDLEIYPLGFKENYEELKTKFLENGRLFCDLSMQAPSNFKNYKGSLFKMVLVDKCWRVRKENADGRVMIDLGSFSKMNPDYKLESALPPCDVIRDNKVTHIDITLDSNRMFSPAMVYGFSFRLKQWGSFSICGFTDIAFNDSAFESLVMDETTKDLTKSMVCEHVNRGLYIERERLDPIGAKGDGCIILCYGSPGTGKTLTAESLAETLHRPLWSLSVAELGTTPAALESTLVKIMDVAVQWRALLLLDEADVYLERRTSSDLTRNAMTGVFLRELEYFRGVIFLTTNRDIAFDEAFCSRISLFLYYEKHNNEQRSKLWRNLLARVGMTDVPADVLERFAQYEFNGREIRNVMQTAQTVARSKRELMNYQHIERALTVLDDSIKCRAFAHSQK